MMNAFSRRQFLLGGLVLAGTGAVAACTSDPGPAASAPGPSLRPTPTPTGLTPGKWTRRGQAPSILPAL